MTDAAKSLLVIAPEPRIADAIARSFAADADVRVDRRTATLAGMNGQAVKAAAEYDYIFFQTDPDDQADRAAIRALVAARRSGTKLVALADGAISLAQARALTEAGIDEVLPLPSDGAAPGRAAGRAGRAGSSGRIIAVSQARGGAGSTTVAVNLADQLANGAGLRRSEPRPKVALVDLDLQFGTVGAFLDLAEQDTMIQLAQEGTIPDETFLDQALAVLPNGLSVLVAPARFAPLDALRAEQVAAILDSLRRRADYVIVDLPRALVGWIEPVIERADEVLVVTDLSVSSVRHCRRLIDFLTQDNPALPVEIVVNRRRRPFFRSQMQREVEKALDRRLHHWLPDDPRAAYAAADRGQPLSRTAPRSPLGKALKALARSTRDTLPVAAQKTVI